jgi:hypothetical protein
MIQLVASKNQNGQIVIRTEGLTSTIEHPEICVGIHDPKLRAEAESFLRFVSDYLTQSQKQICAGETLAYGYWLVKFKQAEPNALETWEYNAQATDFVPGSELALTYWRDQHAICKEHHAAFQPPRPDRLTVISKGVLEGLPVQGVRYPSPEHMSGWWITTDQYDGNIKSLTHEHTYHITAARPDLARYLALPEGFRFDLSVKEDIWLDEKVATGERV